MEWRWYRVPKTHKIYPHSTCFGASIFRDEVNHVGAGEIATAKKVRNTGKNYRNYTGQTVIGTEEDFHLGLRHAALNEPAEFCPDCRGFTSRVIYTPRPRTYESFNFSAGGELTVEASLGCPIPDPLPHVLYGHWHTASGGVCDCYGQELQLSYGSVAFTDYSSIISPVLRTANAWFADQLACDQIIRWVLYRGTDQTYHMQYQYGYPFDGFSLTDTGGFCFDSLSPVSGLAIFAGNSLCVFGEFGEFGITLDESPAHRTDITIFGNFSAGGSLTGESVLTAVGNFSAGGSLPATINLGEIAEGDFSGGGSLHGEFSHLTELDMEGDFGGGGYFSVPITYDLTAEGDFSGGGDLQQG